MTNLEMMIAKPLFNAYWPTLLLPVVMGFVWAWPMLPVMLISVLVLSGAWMLSMFSVQRHHRQWIASVERSEKDGQQNELKNIESIRDSNAEILQQLSLFQGELN